MQSEIDREKSVMEGCIETVKNAKARQENQLLQLRNENRMLKV
jgi:hypothetical protein